MSISENQTLAEIIDDFGDSTAYFDSFDLEIDTTDFAPTLIAAPLLGLSTRNRTVSIYRRVQRIKRRLRARGGSGHSGHHGNKGGIKMSGEVADRKAEHHHEG